jgi:hypothetical protein
MEDISATAAAHRISSDVTSFYRTLHHTRKKAAPKGAAFFIFTDPKIRRAA